MLHKLSKYDVGGMGCRVELDWILPGTLHHMIVRGIEKQRIVNDVADRKNVIGNSVMTVGTQHDA